MSIIKCPECGQQVSTMAGTCPKCGVQIAGKIKKCPKCDNYSFNNLKECPNCSHKFEENPVAESVGEPVVQTKAVKEIKKKRIWPYFIAFPLCIIIVCFGVYYLRQREAIQKELMDFQRLEKVSNPELLKQFLCDYPNSPHYTEVQKRITILTEEKELWEKVLKSKDREVLNQFILEHPQSNKRRICEDLIDSIDWTTAKNQENDEAIENYLTEHPNGKYVEEAVKFKEELNLMRISPEDTLIIREALESFFYGALAKQNLRLTTEAMVDKMEQFYDKKDVTPKQIINLIKGKIKQDVIGINYLIENEFHVKRIRLQNSLLGYEAQFTLKETLERKNNKKSTSQTYKISVKMNSARKITSITQL